MRIDAIRSFASSPPSFIRCAPLFPKTLLGNNAHCEHLCCAADSATSKLFPLSIASRTVTMADKKNEDYVVRMPEGTFDKSEKGHFTPRASSMRSYGSSGPSLAQSVSKLDNSPIVSVLAYCASSISMTIVNKYVVSGQGWNLNFFYLTIQVRRTRSPNQCHTMLSSTRRPLYVLEALRCARTLASSSHLPPLTLIVRRNVCAFFDSRLPFTLIIPLQGSRFPYSSSV